MQQDIDGRIAYSKIVLLQSSTKPLLVAYPNPAKDKLYLDGPPTGYYTIEIADANGNTIKKKMFSGIKIY